MSWTDRIRTAVVGPSPELAPVSALDLYTCVQRRPRPEDVADLIGQFLGDELTKTDAAILQRASRHSLRHAVNAYSSMADDFKRPDGATKQIETGAALFKVPALTTIECMDGEKVREFVIRVSGQIAKPVGGNDFKSDRLPKAERIKVGTVPKGHRAYNKRFRFLIRLEDKIERMLKNDVKFGYTRMAKSAFATHLMETEFLKDANTACFVAYMAARMNLRSEFTNGPQVRAYDEIAQMLYRRAVSKSPNWWAMAHVFPEQEVLANLTDEQKGRLMGMWFESLCGIANFLKSIVDDQKLDTGTMIVRRGQDSSTWNATAGAWNKVRSGWIELLHTMGADEILDRVCPGKVLRLMAADVARWHGSLHPDTKVWAELPPPWLVFNGDADCSRALVESVCDRHGVDRKGWTSPRSARQATTFTPTPELVHGVTVSSAHLAKVLRRAGIFSGKSVKGDDFLF